MSWQSVYMISLALCVDKKIINAWDSDSQRWLISLTSTNKQIDLMLPTHMHVLHTGLAGSGWPFLGSLKGSYWQPLGHSQCFNTALLISRTCPWWHAPCVRENKTRRGLFLDIQAVKTKVETLSKQHEPSTAAKTNFSNSDASILSALFAPAPKVWSKTPSHLLRG